MNSQMHLFILSGGSGTRLWPISRQSYPKQYAEILEEGLLSQTISRLNSLGRVSVVSSDTQKVLCDRICKSHSISALYEPIPKNTAPAVLLGLKSVLFSRQDLKSTVLGFFPADHHIQETNKFQEAVLQAKRAALETGRIITIGLEPTFPATGYGYIELSEKASPLKTIQSKSFKEKPSLEQAKTFIHSGNFLWNGGMFIATAECLKNEFIRCAPDLWKCFESLDSSLSNLAEVYKNSQSISLDYALMEKQNEFYCVAGMGLGWSDVGSWDALNELPDSIQTKKTKNQIEYKSNNNSIFVGSESMNQKVYALSDVSDLIVVDTPDAMMVLHKGESQNVKELYQLIEKKYPHLVRDHPFEYRPWGYFEILRDEKNFKSKIIRVDPGQQLSYQSHQKRAEHWIILSGSPEVVLNDVIHKPKAGEHIFIPQGAKHRMRNPGKELVEFVEVQVGTYFGEDDITRYQDDYQRK